MNSLSGQPLVDKAREIAHTVHSGQFRADGRTSYIQHPEDVCNEFCRMWNNGEVYISRLNAFYEGQALALVHDTLVD